MLDKITKEDIKQWAKDHVIPHFAIRDEIKDYGPKILVKGKDARVWDIDGKEYIDAMSILWVVNAGHGREKIINAMYEQMQKISYVSLFGGYFSEPAIKLAKRLVELAPSNIDAVFFATGGSEAIETAIKLARQYHKIRGKKDKYKVIGRWEAYHGVTYGALSVSGIRQNRNLFEALVPGFLHVPPPYCYRCPFNKKYPECNLECANQIENTIRNEGPNSVSAVVIEPVMSALGSVPPPEGYLKRVREICDNYDVVLIIDEVNNAFGRIGDKLFASLKYEIEPDIITLGKGITSGYAPLSAALVSKKISSVFDKWMFVHGLTFGGHPVSTAAALANIDIMLEEKLPERSAKMGKYLLEKLNELKEELDIIGDVRGVGLHTSIEYVKDKKTKEPIDPRLWIAKKIEYGLLKRGIYLARASVDRTYIAPPLIITKEEIDEIIDKLKDTIYEVSKEIL